MNSVQKIQQNYLKLNKSIKRFLSMCLAQTKRSAESFRNVSKDSPPKMFPGNMGTRV